jgi:uncharacterized membrane protein YqgA involved in biofilm formation
LSGVLLNIATVLVGTAIGLLCGKLIPERFRQIAFYAIGSCTIGFGAIMAINGFNDLTATKVGSFAAIVLVVSMVAGALCGELLKIEARLESLGTVMHRLLRRSSRGDSQRSRHPARGEASPQRHPARDEAEPQDPAERPQSVSDSSTFAEGFMTASIFFCAGAMTVMGSIQAGLGDPSTLYLKATLDGISAIALTTALGIGVGFSVATILVVQGGLALGAGLIGGFFTAAIMASINLVGGVMLIALGLEILGIKKLRVGNMLPALVFATLLGWLLG